MQHQFGFLFCAWLMLGASSVSAEEPLSDLSLQELLEVEISLDRAFDIFGALVATPKVSVATGKRQDAFLAPAVTTVITAQDMEAMGTRTLSEALQTVPGLYVGRDWLYQPLFMMRGISSGNNPELLVMINGEPLKGLESGNRGLGWRDMPINGIARIEIIRGPGSALYGADAFSGTVNLITKTAEDMDGNELGARVGSFHTFETWLLHGKRHGAVEVSTTLEFLRTEGPDKSVARDAQTRMDALTGTQVSLAPGEISAQERTLNARLDIAREPWRLRLGYQGQRDAGIAVGAMGALDDRGGTEQDRVNLDLVYDNPRFTPNWHLTAQWNYTRADVQTQYWFFPPGTVLPVTMPDLPRPLLLPYPDGVRLAVDTGEEHFHTSISGFYAGFDRHLLRVGGGYRYEDLYHVGFRANIGQDAFGAPIPPGSPMIDLSDTPGAVYPEEQRQSYYGYVQDTWRLSPRWDFTWGLRHDHYSDFGATTNPRAALVWQINPRFTAKALYGRAFRAPSFRELYMRNNLASLGDPNLNAEKMETVELAFNWRALDRLNLGLNLYRYEIKDTIQLVRVSTTDSRLISANMGEVKGHGVEWEARWKFHQRASVMTNYAWVDVKRSNPPVGKAQQVSDTSAPRQQGYLRLDWRFAPNWYLNGQVTWWDEQTPILVNDQHDPVEAAFSVDLMLRYKNIQNTKWNFALGARNLLDEDLRTVTTDTLPDNVPLAGRQLFAEFRYRFD